MHLPVQVDLDNQHAIFHADDLVSEIPIKYTLFARAARLNQTTC
jgi:hypothetical protein